jgi:glycosyltransferase involved in cell wall biosynthesis
MGAQRIDLPPLPHPERVRIVGKVSYEEMAAYYRAADVCVSLTSSDSSPRSIWEAMACAAPCILSDLPWVEELIEPGRDAVTVPVDAGAMATAVLDLLADPGRAAEIGRGGRTLVERHLDRDAQMDGLLAHYRELVAGSA